jgi:hypothetical protein
MVVNYKNHTIEYFGDPIAFTDKWRGKVRISWDENGTRKVVPFDSPLTGFSSLLEAEAWGLEVGKKWIDDGKPGLFK